MRFSNLIDNFKVLSKLSWSKLWSKSPTQKRATNILALLGDSSYENAIVSTLTLNFNNVVVIRRIPNSFIKCEFYHENVRKWNFKIFVPFPKKHLYLWLTLPFALLLEYLMTILIFIIASYKANIKKYDVCIGEGYNRAIAGIIIKKILKTEKVVYWAIDWFPRQSLKKVKLLTYMANSVFFPHLDKFCCKNSDHIWNFSQRIVNARNAYWNGAFELEHKQFVVCPPLINRNIKPIKTSKIYIGFIGLLKKNQGVELIIDAMAELKKEGINIYLDIIGTSSYENELKKYSEKKGLLSNVTFHGYISSTDKQIYKIVGRWRCAFALYEGGKENHSFYAWPSKVAFYLECGIPIIMTNVPSIAEDVYRENLGKIINYDIDELKKAILELVLDDTAFTTYKENIYNYIIKKQNNKIVDYIRCFIEEYKWN